MIMMKCEGCMFTICNYFGGWPVFYFSVIGNVKTTVTVPRFGSLI
jgi:hypothetical protein